MGSVSNLNPLTDVTKNNKSVATPSISTITVGFDRVTITGSHLDLVTGMKVTGTGANHTLTLSGQTASVVEGLVTSPSLSFYAQQTYDLIISSASGQTVYPINFQMLDLTVSTSKLQTSSVTTDKIANKNVTYGKLETGDASDGDVLTYSQADDAWLPAPPTAGGGGGGSVSSISRGSGLMNQGSSITTTGSIAVNIGSGSGQIPTLNGSGDFSFGNSIILDSQMVGEGLLSIQDSGDTSDFIFYNVGGTFHLQYSQNAPTTYNDAMTISDSTGYVTFLKDVYVGGALYANTQGTNTSIKLPTGRGNSGEFLMTDGAGTTSWAVASGTGTVTSVGRGVGFASSGTPITTTGTLDLDVGTTGTQIPQLVGGLLPQIIIPTGISANKIGATTNVSDAEFEYLANVTSDIQGQFTGKQDAIANGVANQYLRFDKTWSQVKGSELNLDAGTFMTIYNGVPRTVVGGGSITQPVSEVAVADALASMASLTMSPQLIGLNTTAPTLGKIIVGNIGGTYDFFDYYTYLMEQFQIPGRQSNLLLGMGTGIATIAAGGLYNVGVGSGAMAAITTGDENTALGYMSLNGISTGNSNTALGSETLALVTGNYNTAVGADTMNATAVGITYNTGIGYKNMPVVTGSYNTSMGGEAFLVLAAGASNMAAGYHAGYAQTSASNNTLIGAEAAKAITTGGNNVAVGYQAGNTLVSGTGNVFLGYGAGALMNAGSTSNVVIGLSAGPAAGAYSNTLYLDNSQTATPLIGGNFSTDIVYINHDPNQLVDLPGGVAGLWVDGDAYKSAGGSSWAVTSDQRLKERIADYDRGLEEILALRPVRFHYKNLPALGLSSKAENIGVIAQEVQKEIPEAVVMGAKGYLSFKLDPVIWAGVNAIQELNEKVEKLEQENKLLKSYLCEKDPKAPFCR